MTSNFYNSLVTPQWAHIEYTWKLEKIWELRALASINALGDSPGNFLVSSCFGDKYRGLWRLKVYPYGDFTAMGKGNLSVFLTLDTASQKELYAIFSCSIMNSQQDKVEHGPSYARQKFSQSAMSWGWSKFISMEATDSLNCVSNDILILKCTIDIFLGVLHVPSDVSLGSSLTEDLYKYFSSPDSHDIELICHGVVLPTCRALLASRSPVFKALVHQKQQSNVMDDASKSGLENSTNVSKKNLPQNEDMDYVEFDSEGRAKAVIISRKNIKAKAMEQLLHFMVHDTCEILDAPDADISLVLSVFYASWVYEISPLYNRCITLLVSRIDGAENAFQILQQAREMDCTILLTQCSQYLASLGDLPQWNKETIMSVLPLCTKVEKENISN